MLEVDLTPPFRAHVVRQLTVAIGDNCKKEICHTRKHRSAIRNFQMRTSDLLSKTNKLFEALEVYQVSTLLQPDKQHWAAHIQLQDFNFNKLHLIERMRQSIIDWVFSRKEAKRIFDDEYGADQDLSGATAALYQAARETFRVSAPQGQFGELLLSSFLQHIFKATPLLRKQAIRTSDNHERFGADAIHFSNENGHHLYLGESKCYKSLYQFPAAFKISLESMNTTLAKYSEEIKKFHVGGFIDESLKPIASDILRNRLSNLEIHPVIIIIYNESKSLTGNNSDEIKKEIKQAISHECGKIDKKLYSAVEIRALKRFTYIIMPVWELDKLLDDFVDSL